MTAPRCECARVPVLCGCGWGSLAMPECEVPECCPVCGFNFWEAFGEPEWCDALPADGIGGQEREDEPDEIEPALTMRDFQ